jgi:hypothetical protein
LVRRLIVVALLLGAALARSRFGENNVSSVMDEVVHARWASAGLGVMVSTWTAGRLEAISDALLH